MENVKIFASKFMSSLKNVLSLFLTIITAFIIIGVSVGLLTLIFNFNATVGFVSTAVLVIVFFTLIDMYD